MTKSHDPLDQNVGRDHRPEIDALISGERVKRLALTAIILAALALLAAICSVLISYSISREAILRDTLEHTHSLAVAARNHAEILTDLTPETNVYRGLSTFWQRQEVRISGSYLRIVRLDGVVVLHTSRPDLIGADVGNEPLQAHVKGGAATLKELIVAGGSYVGPHISAFRERQIVAFVFSERLHLMFGVHVPEAEVNAQIHDRVIPWIIGFALIIGVILPLLFGAMVWLYSRTLRRVGALQRDLRESEERYRALYENNPSTYLTVDTNGKILSVNQFGAEQLGYTVKELMGQSVLNVLYEGDKTRFWSTLTVCLQNPTQVAHCEFRKVRRDESILWVKGDAHAVRGADGNTFVLIVCADITDRKRAEQALAAERERLAVTLRSIGDGVILIDANRRIVLANPAGQEYLILLANAGVDDVLTHLGNQPFERLLEPPPKGKTYHELVLREPIQYIFEVSVQPTETEPQAGGWVLLIRDATEERAMRQRVETRERLAAIGQLAAGIAHDFNNTLSVIIGLSQLVQKDPTISEKACEQIGLVIQQGYRASILVQQILDFSRQSVPERRHLDLLPLLEENIRLLERTIPEHIRIIIEFIPEEYWVLADPTQIQQVITNLALNAQDAMPQGGELRIQLAHLHLKSDMRPPLPEMPLGDWITLSVSDTGIGIAPENIPHIFEPFFTTKGIGKGTGLGLAQAYGIVKQHDGFVDFVSEVSKGTTFTIYLPAFTEKKAVVPEKQQEEVISGQGEKILVVEDEPLVLETTKAMLEKLEYRILTATNGKEALEVYDQHRNEIALVLTDMVMPEMDGVALFQALKERNPSVKVLILTGYLVGEKAEELLSLGVVDRLQKPIDFVRLSQVVGRALGKKA